VISPFRLSLAPLAFALATVACLGLFPAIALAADPPSGPLAGWSSVKGLEGLDVAFDYLHKLEPGKIVPGRTAIVGDDVFATASTGTTRPVEDGRFEVHRKFIDVQYIVKGQEMMGFRPQVDGLVVVEPFAEAKDVGFFARPDEYTRVPVREGQYAVFFPGQAHMPGRDLEGPHEFVKVVVKVSKDWYEAHVKEKAPAH
jgi:biofilm protein TabA